MKRGEPQHRLIVNAYNAIFRNTVKIVPYAKDQLISGHQIPGALLPARDKCNQKSPNIDEMLKSKKIKKIAAAKEKIKQLKNSIQTPFRSISAYSFGSGLSSTALAAVSISYKNRTNSTLIELTSSAILSKT